METSHSIPQKYKCKGVDICQQNPAPLKTKSQEQKYIRPQRKEETLLPDQVWQDPHYILGINKEEIKNNPN